MIRIITDTTFGYRKGKTIEPKTKDSEPFELTKKREKELVEMGIAEYVEEQEEEKADNMEDVKEAAEEEIPEEEPADEDREESGDEPQEYTLKELESLKLDELVTIGELHGIKYEKGTKKGEFVKIIYEAMNEDDEEEAPDLTV